MASGMFGDLGFHWGDPNTHPRDENGTLIQDPQQAMAVAGQQQQQNQMMQQKQQMLQQQEHQRQMQSYAKQFGGPPSALQQALGLPSSVTGQPEKFTPSFHSAWSPGAGFDFDRQFRD